MFLTACSSSSDGSLVVWVRTDFVFGAEVFAVRTEILEAGTGSDARVDSWRDVFVTDPQPTLRVASYESVPLGPLYVRTRLLDQSGQVVLERIAHVTIDGNTLVTLVMTRACRDVMCPLADPLLVACVAGGCVDPRCSPETPKYCPLPVCESTMQCPVPGGCAESSCEEGVCLERSQEGFCASTQWCDGAQCRPRPMLPDASMSDAGVDSQSMSDVPLVDVVVPDAAVPDVAVPDVAVPDVVVPDVVVATCADGVRNGGETDLDCGGPCGATCALGETCGVPTDCASMMCSGMMCTAACSYGRHRTFTIQAPMVPEDLVDFPVMVTLSGAEFRIVEDDVTDLEGDDIVFRDGVMGAVLSHEIEVYDAGAELLVMWVKVPSVSRDANTEITMWYGNACVTTSTQNVPDVWSNGFVAVFHLNELTTDEQTTGVMTDSLGDFDGLQNGNEVTSGRIGNGQLFDGDDDYVDVSSMSPQSIDDYTITAWYRSATNSVVDDQYIFDVCQSQTLGPCFTLGVTDDGSNRDRVRVFNQNSSTAYYYGTTNVMDRQWHYLAGTRGGGRVGVYVDGSQESNGVDELVGETFTIPSSNTPNMGDSPGNTEQVNGALDEVRVATVGRTSGWIAAEFNNQDSPGTFYVIGPEL